MTRFKSKRLLSSLLAAILMFSMLTVSASAEEPDLVIEETESIVELPETEIEEDIHIHPDADEDIDGSNESDAVSDQDKAAVASTCAHSMTVTNWITNCRWEQYCVYCGAFISSGIIHGPYTHGSWQYYNETKHMRSYTCMYGDSETFYQTADHTATMQYAPFDVDRHSVSRYCSTCSSFIGSPTYEDHMDSNDDGICDGCGYEMAYFSVTIPAGLTLTVSEWGEVYAATSAAIVNNSSAAVRVTDIVISAENGWTLVPYGTNMACDKVDAGLIGFAVNGASTTKNTSSESLLLPRTWTIDPAGSLPLAYDAVVSATSRVIWSEQVLTVVFMLEWA